MFIEQCYVYTWFWHRIAYTVILLLGFGMAQVPKKYKNYKIKLKV